MIPTFTQLDSSTNLLLNLPIFKRIKQPNFAKTSTAEKSTFIVGRYTSFQRLFNLILKLSHFKYTVYYIMFLSKSESNYSHFYVQGKYLKMCFKFQVVYLIKWKLIAIYSLKQNIFWTIVSNVKSGSTEAIIVQNNCE